jgi:hypothetical protein
LAGPPFGGDDTGFIPSTPAIAKCEDGLTKNVGKLAKAIITCHLKTGNAQFKGKPFDEEACEAAAEEKFSTAATKKQKGCPACVVSNTPNIPGIIEGAIDGNNGNLACDGTTPFGDSDDTGFVPSSKASLKCESSVAKNVGKLVNGLLTCHVKTADAGLKGKPFDEEACEGTVITKYTAANAKLKGCPVCLDPSIFVEFIEQFVDQGNSLLYCSPSGA